jgi:hypothetical protein
MHRLQRRYAVAKAMHDTLQADVRAHHAALWKAAPDDMDEQTMEAICGQEIEFETQIGYLAAGDALRDAEQAMIEWGREEALSLPCTPDERQQIADLFEKGPRMVAIRQKLVDLVFRLDGTIG